MLRLAAPALALLVGCAELPPPRPSLDELPPGPVLLYARYGERILVSGPVYEAPPREVRLLMTGGRARTGRPDSRREICRWTVGWTARIKAPDRGDLVTSGDAPYAVAVLGEDGWRLASLRYAGCSGHGDVMLWTMDAGGGEFHGAASFPGPD